MNRAGEAGEGTKLSTDGTRLDGLWMGGSGIATWSTPRTAGGSIAMPDLGSRSAELVQNAVRREAASAGAKVS